MTKELYFEDIKFGTFKTGLSKAITEEDIQKYCELTGETNFSHLDEGHIKEFGFEKKLVPGYYLLALAAGLIRRDHPLRIVALRRNHAVFKRPVYVGDQVYVESMFFPREDEKPERKYGRVQVDRVIKNQNDIPCIQGGVTLLIEKRGGERK